MALGKFVLGAALTVSFASYLIAADEPATPATQPTTKPSMRAHKLTEPWSLLKTLTPEQTTQIEKIHADAYEQTKKIDAKEEDDIKALLSADQVAELKTAEEKLKAERKEKMSRHKKETATTEPAK